MPPKSPVQPLLLVLIALEALWLCACAGAPASAETQSRRMLVAAGVGDVTVLREAIDGGAFLRAVSKAGDSAIHLAARNHHVDAVSYMVSRGLEIDLQNDLGDTALHDSIRLHDVAMERFLRERGAYDSVRNEAGLAPADMRDADAVEKETFRLVARMTPSGGWMDAAAAKVDFDALRNANPGLVKYALLRAYGLGSGVRPQGSRNAIVLWMRLAPPDSDAILARLLNNTNDPALATLLFNSGRSALQLAVKLWAAGRNDIREGRLEEKQVPQWGHF